MNNYQSNRNTSMHIHNTAFTTTSPTQHQVMGAPMPTTTQHMNIGGDAACRHMQSAVDLLLASASFQSALSARSQSQSQSQPQFQPQPLLQHQSLLDSQQFLLPRSLPRSPITTSNGMDTIPNAAIHIPPTASGGVDWSPPQAQQLMSTTTTTTTATNNANAVADANANGATLVSRPKNAGTPITERRTTRTSNYIIEAEIITIPKRAIPLRDIETPHENDVLSGRGQSINFHSGNQHFRHLVRSLKIQYLNSKKSDKPKFAEGIVDAIRNLPGQPGRFLKQDKNGLWYDIGDKRACLKTRQSLREGAPQFLKPVPKFKCSSSTNSSISTPLPSSSGSPFTATSGISVALHEEI
jgi:hypothetical protein